MLNLILFETLGGIPFFVSREKEGENNWLQSFKAHLIYRSYTKESGDV